MSRTLPAKDRGSIRTSAKAVIIEHERILALRLERPNVYFTLPGGGQNPGEALSTTLRRECMEELGISVTVEDLLFVRDYIAENHEFVPVNRGLHQVELIFRCRRTGGEAISASQPDLGQVGFEWLPIDRLMQFDLFPRTLRPHIMRLSESTGPAYLGDVN